ncbi:MAG: hypothetical protein FWD23_00405 [Oscillospiraceae bacterium]|nr:hypothetical protein [Oscillospiraceae bacterium]
MDDVFFKKLKQVTISSDTEKTKERLKEIWANADKENKKELVKNAGPAIYNAIGKITKSGRITAKMAIMLSRYLDVNPFYLTGATDENAPYSEILLKEFLIKLGYKTLWQEYEKFLIKFDMANAGDDDEDEDDDDDDDDDDEEYDDDDDDEEYEDEDDDEEYEDEDDDTFEPVLNLEKNIGYYIKDEDTKSPEIPEDASAPDEAVKNLTDEEVLVLLRALLIRARANAGTAKIADRIKALLLSN